ncbi:MAG TPA: aquaporin [Thermoleophilaceae bacterium]
MEERGVAAYIGEFIGTFALVFFITAVVSLFVTPPTPGAATQPFIDWSVVGLVHIFVLFMLIQTLAVISGAHFNPAVTLAMAAIRQIKPADAVVYWAMQLAGGTLGALLTKALLLNEGRDVNWGAVGVSNLLDGKAGLGFVCELIGTFFLMWAIVGVAVNPAGLKDWSGFVIGGTLGFLVMIFGSLTGAGFNPARAFGPALVASDFGGAGKFLLVYVAGPLVGATLAALTYVYLFVTPGRREVGAMEPVG